MTKKVVLASLKDRINLLIDRSPSDRFDYIYALQKVLVMIEDYE